MNFKILHIYIWKNLIRNIFLSTVSLIILFLVFDFFDRIDNILPKDPDFLTVVQYFLFKIPQFFILTLPIAFVIATLFTYGLLSKNSEMTAMRASGLTISWLARPLFLTAFVFSLLNLICGELIVPESARRVKEIYNIDIQQKDLQGTYSQNNIWWRENNNFYSVEAFDSRDATLHTYSRFRIDSDYVVKRRENAERVDWVNPVFGWNMKNVLEYEFIANKIQNKIQFKSLPLLIEKQPKDFFHSDTEPLSMAYFELHDYIQEQKANGQPTNDLLPDLYAKISFPFVILICSMAVLPLAIRPARSGSMAASFIFGILICFAYYAVHSFSIALGRAELISPLMSAWLGNIVLSLVGLFLYLGSEAPE